MDEQFELEENRNYEINPPFIVEIINYSAQALINKLEKAE
jgi:hypothetical protein